MPSLARLLNAPARLLAELRATRSEVDTSANRARRACEAERDGLRAEVEALRARLARVTALAVELEASDGHVGKFIAAEVRRRMEGP
jgi:uncharacterized membrane protein YccC